jgi:hypothetical protein
MRNQPTMSAPSALRYADAVVRVLAEEFPSALRNTATQAIIAGAITRHAQDPSDTLEVIVNPETATWRLTANREHPHRVRLAHCPVNPEWFDNEREHRVNVALATIPQD